MPTNPTRLDFTMKRDRRADPEQEIDRLNAQIDRRIAERRVMVEQTRVLEERTKQMGLALLRADHVEQDDWKGTTRCRAGRRRQHPQLFTEEKRT
jgi:hypothetical protein